ncbi:sensor histidine kinase [Sulfurimonas gotlandica]|uniref:sensor histidine kinase n=1 Tax=Sulfurimonas gotlandica TaxID=1176482 RepID=UPI0001838FEB|nr:HAMP domain-containing sensor histidine kinase [Sulfurimonas gotlandica]EDZ62200.1 multi-sensor signal transduction histidine kinase [Sulfurimonas gotlandica GD1]
MLDSIKNIFLPKTLFGRLIILPSVSVFLGFLIITFLAGYNQYSFVKEELEHDSKVIIKELSASLEKYLLLHDYGEIESIMRRFSLIEVIQSISLIDENSMPLLTIRKDVNKELQLEINTDKKYTNIEKHAGFFFTEDNHSYFSYKPIGNSVKKKWVMVEMSKEIGYARLMDLLLLVNITGIILIGFLSFIIYKIIYQPLKHIEYLTSFSSTLHKSYGVNCEVNSSIYEINSLADSLNQLSQELLKNQAIRTKQNEELRVFNTELTSRVEEEVLKNREKDILLLNNSRLAALAEMIGNIAHQWRQPLNAIALLIQSLQISYELDDLNKKEFNEFVDDSLLQVDYLSRTIDDFRDLTKDEIDNEPFNVSEILSKTFRLIEPSLMNASIQSTLDIQDGIICHHSSANALSQAIINILNNAKDALIQQDVNEKEIHIQLKQVGTTIEISINDNAGGIPTEIIEKIFNAYFTTKHQSNGTGLGLYISKKIINKEMDGRLEVINNAKGACFRIVFSNSRRIC